MIRRTEIKNKKLANTLDSFAIVRDNSDNFQKCENRDSSIALKTIYEIQVTGNNYMKQACLNNAL